MRNKIVQRMLSVVLVLCMIAALALPTIAATVDTSFHKVSNDRVSANLFGREPASKFEKEPDYEDTDVVRVSIVLEDAGTLDAGYSPENIADNAAAMQYRNALKNKQDALSSKISMAMGQKLDVVWNMTLAANIISANVPYGQIATIQGVSGVENVVLETVYEIDVVDKGGLDPDMATSGSQIGTGPAYALDYTGAGSRIAIIDTGLDASHISFDSGAYMYSLSLLAEEKGMDLDTYLEKLDLLDADEVADVLPNLNMYAMMGSDVTAADLFVNDKVPFGFNYVDENTNILHIYDLQGEHGSHVAGISAANAYVPDDDGYAKALEKVLVQGVAPDAQLMIMKVFGAAGGAYDSDYMVAIEDAILLGADSINLSLGSAAPGMTSTSSAEYEAIFANLEGSGVVVSISAGNSSNWSANVENNPYGLLYLDDVNQHTGGSPGTYTNSLGVASVDNSGYTGLFMSVNGNYFTYAESASYGNPPIATVGGEQEFVFLNNIGTPDQFAALDAEVDLEDKVVMCYRGETSFYEKANAAAALGAKAIIIVNNQPGILYLNLTGYEYEVPVVCVSQTDGEYFKYQPLTGSVEGWTGTVYISTSADILESDSNYYTMSEFSSWGVPGSLIMKPEITAPGGSIYSVAGAYYDGENYYFSDNASYEQMSGTSMAAPQVAGMAALLAQYIRESGLEEKTGLDARTLAQSLLMSTAVPVLDGTNGGYYYPVIQQGAGLANVGNAILADSYILMGQDATASYADGKVKAELGDDPNRSGEYSFSFTIYNLTGEEKVYNLYSDMFTQGATYDNYGTLYTTPQTMSLYHSASWTVNGSASDGTATVPANGSATVTVTIELDADDKEFLDAYYTSGAFVQGYVYAESATSGDAEGTCHSIPVLGFYGSWADPSMYDKGSWEAYMLSGEENRAPYLYSSNFANGLTNALYLGSQGDEYFFGGNLYVEDDVYMPERNALSATNGDVISGMTFATIRSAGAAFLILMDAESGSIMALQPVGTNLPSAYFGANSGVWENTYYSLGLDFTPDGIPEGTRLELGILMVPEYYISANGSIDPAVLSDGTIFSMEMTIDNTAPVVNDMTLTADTLTVNITDNEYVAAVALLDSFGEYIYTVVGSNATAAAGATCDFALDLTDVNGAGFLVAVYDYAGNLSVYELDEIIGETTDTVESIDVNPASMILQKGESDYATAIVYPVNATNRNYTWSSSDESIVTVDEYGNVTAIAVGTAEIVATSVADPTVTGSCEVTVVDIHANLNAIVWDENGSIYFSEFDTDTMPEYNKLSPDMLETDYFTSAAVAPDGTIYATSFNTNSSRGNASLYVMDPKTWEPTLVAALPYGLTDMTYAPNMYGQGAILGTFGGNVLAYNPANGEWMDVPDYFAGTGLIGIASVYSGYNETYELYEDHIVYIDNEGNVYYEIYLSMTDPESGSWLSMCLTANDDGSHTPYMATGVDKSGTMYFNSAYYEADSGLLYWSAFDDSVDNSVSLYAIDLENGLTVKLGEFADSVWPVGGLFEMPCLHEHTELKDASDGDCTTPGYSGDLYCLDCGELLEEGHDTETDPDNHSYVDEVTPPTTTSRGYTTHTCERCGHSYVDTYTNMLPVDESNSDTGENVHLQLWIPMLLVSAAAVTTLVVYRKKLIRA